MIKFANSLIGAAFIIVASISSAQSNTPWATSGSIGIGTTNPGRTFDVFGQARATYLWAGQTGANQDGRLYVTDASGNIKIYLGGYPTESSYFATGNVGIGTVAPSTLLQVAGPITAGSSGGSTSGIDYLYGNYGNGKLFALGSQYSSAASFLGYAVKAQPGATGYLSSTGITLGRSSVEANNGYLSFLTGAQQASSDGGAVSISEKMRIDATGRVGIGTATPSTRLTVVGSGAGDGLTVREDGSYGVTSLYLTNGSGNVATRNWLIATNLDANGALSFRAGNAVSTDPFSSGVTALMVSSSGNVGVGTINPTQKLSVNGTIRAKEVIVETTGWSDYVFADNYVLQPLSQIEEHIKEHRHLPGIPSAKQVSESGIGLGEMQAKLLAKIEEITLHQIAQEKELLALKEQNSALKSRIQQLESR